jgi:hypothetical protein
MRHDVSIILSSYLSDNYIENYFNNIKALINVASIQLVHILNDPTKKEISFKDKFENFQLSSGKNFFEYKYLIVKRETLYSSWNRAIKLSDSRLITISNVDDVRYPDGLKAQISAFNKCKKMFLLGSNFKIKTENGLVSKNIRNKKKIRKNDLYSGMYLGPFFMWTNPIYMGKKHQLFDEQFSVAGDFDFQIRFAAFGTVKILEKEIGEYYNNNTGLSTNSIFQLIEGQVIYHRYNIVDKKITFFSLFFFKNHYSQFFCKIESIKYSIEQICPEFKVIKLINSKRRKNIYSYLMDYLNLIKTIIKFYILKIRY